jgi:hypothetical protein
METIMNTLGINSVEGYEYIYEILKGCLAVFLSMELISWLKVLTKDIFKGV